MSSSTTLCSLQVSQINVLLSSLFLRTSHEAEARGRWFHCQRAHTVKKFFFTFGQNVFLCNFEPLVLPLPSRITEKVIFIFFLVIVLQILGDNYSFS